MNAIASCEAALVSEDLEQSKPGIYVIYAHAHNTLLLRVQWMFLSAKLLSRQTDCISLLTALILLSLLTDIYHHRIEMISVLFIARMRTATIVQILRQSCEVSCKSDPFSCSCSGGT